MEYPWGTGRRFNAYVNYLKEKFGHRIQKVAVDAGFTCPNRDGTLGRGGCTYCDNDAFNPSYCISSKTIKTQIEEGIAFQKTRYKNAHGFFAYFQAYSNTYASLEELRKIYAEALSVEGIRGLVIGTRPDTITDEILDYLAELSSRSYIIVEYGVESCYDKTLSRINRGHDFATAVKAIEKTAARGLPVGGHFIFGLPGESRKEMLDEAAIISELPFSSLKFHQLQIFRNTPMEGEFLKKPGDFHIFDYAHYKDFIIDFLELLTPHVSIERLAGEAPPRFIAANQWDIRNDQIMVGIEKQLEQRNTWQGRKFGDTAN